MGYTTNFSGRFKLNKKMDSKLKDFLLDFKEQRHKGESKYEGTPGIWCGWEVSEDSEYIQWDECEKFYGYTDWIKYLIEHFLAPNGYELDGEVEWQGEESNDIGMICITDNKVEVKHADVTYEDVDTLLAENKQMKEEIAELILLNKS